MDCHYGNIMSLIVYPAKDFPVANDRDAVFTATFTDDVVEARSKEIISRTFRPRRSSSATKHFIADEELCGRKVLLPTNRLLSLSREVLKYLERNIH